jgi:DNA-binding response OmpR family regulator
MRAEHQSRPRVLVVEDDSSISLGLRMNLEAEGYEVTLAQDGESGLALAREGWDLIVLDVMLPRVNGFEIVRALRAEANRTPILLLSARGAEVDKVTGLGLGADDYVTKPFGLAELLARVRVALRRSGVHGDEEWRFGEIAVHVGQREVTCAGTAVELTAKEFDVLATLVRAHGRVLTREQILDAVWGANHHGTPRTVDNFIAQLRTKLEEDPAAPRHLLTVRGVGYRFAA